MKSRIILGATLLSLAVPISVGIAQTAGIPTPIEADAVTASQAANSLEDQAGKTADAADKKKLTENLFSVGVSELLELEKGKAIETSLVFRSQPKVDEPVSIEGVTIDGYTSYATYNGKVIGQTVITSLKKEGMIVDLDAQDFSSQYNMDTPRIDPEQEISIKGNEAALVRALKTLNGEDVKEEEEKGEEEEKEEVQEKSDGGSPAINSSGAKDKAANGYQTPDRREVADPKEEIKITEEGCKPVYDSVQNVVKGQNKTQTFKDGVLVNETVCEPSGVTFTVQQQYGTCPDVVDVPGRSAKPQYQAYYLDDVKVRKDLGECQPDLNQTFSISEKDSCPINIDLVAKTATVVSSLVYTDRNNTERVVQSCQPSETTPALPLILNTAACSIKHDFYAGKSKEMGTWTYMKDNVTYQASDCIDTGNVFTHNVLFKENGVDVCPVILNMDTKIAIPQSRTQIEVKGTKQFIDECKPDQTVSKGIRATTDTCDDPASFTHDLGAGISYGRERYYYENPDRIFVNECQQSATSYTHSVEIMGWVNDDAKLSGQALSTVSISVDGTRYNITENTLLAGAPQVGYSLVKEEDIPRDGDAAIDGCQKTTPSTLVRTYTRPDGSEYVLEAGEGNGIVSDVCTRDLENKNYSKTKSYSRYPSDCSQVWGTITTYQEYKTRYKIKYPDGRIEYTSWSSKKKKLLSSKQGYIKGPRFGSSQC
ncbi:hypothetical protein [Pseudovibrio sp. Tun.PSC04-5.I4]|uniref:hypothetical protein n=1 Tax=Pseudovibrio sp. Tun.PSC04-5.I4 TaxID=1798213 RepID=UPI000881A5DF|nr:hypothetical protein [Pseudovibrio sp. Tun.PSC04-5.I4]SDR49022.1 hypothetical protein SAMN04515695_6107 [Pseudovibrio sp. Tun.PSC04-5.I4]